MDNTRIPKTAVLMAAYNKAAILDICLDAINKSDYKKYIDVYVVDNGSVENIHAITEKHHVHYIRLEKNVYVSRALNELYEHFDIGKTHKYAVFMGNDAMVDNRTFCEMALFLETHKDVGVTGPVHYEWNSKIARSRGLTIDPITSLLVNFMDDKPEYRMNHFHSMYMIRTEAFNRVKGFDHILFPMIFEEPDIGERIRKHGYDVRCSMKSNIWHPIELETKKEEVTSIKVRQDRLYSNKPKAYLFFRNRIIYMSLYSSIWQFILFLFVFNPMIFLYYLPTIKTEDRQYALSGMWHGFVFAISRNRDFIRKKNKEVLDI